MGLPALTSHVISPHALLDIVPNTDSIRATDETRLQSPEQAALSIPLLLDLRDPLRGL